MDRIDSIMKDYPELQIKYVDMPDKLGGFIYGTTIFLDKNRSEDELIAILYEEIGHYKTTVGNIIKDGLGCAKQERTARVWGMKQHLSPETLEKYSAQNIDSDYEVANELGVKVSYLHDIGAVYGYKYKHLAY
ncbi:hypothetical protein [Loigolactobacillus bifermentans]|uniref:IrrE N-terminal-like domain-containing protein n=1 Tax=Loigolactobacillus bifermentans DSM 20003 TaxID=1423726 RepID=A0A0R1GSH3_9LACO|nr:hypothetical protein [Loigolactobacillus bifermentans]KRK34410.1 hypothetical protein FC07_GL000619 [Loigolactobacillus bifermentans DSM 20003]QGG60121.1 hypothetical protein LB003_06450 [Loigolactobacillus bifermentans]